MQIIFVFLKYDKVFKCTDYGENYGILMLLSDFMNIHFKTPCWMGQFGNGSLISLRRGLPSGHWALLGMLFPCSQGDAPFPSGLPRGRRRARLWIPLEGRGTNARGRLVSEKPCGSCSAVHWVCMFLCTTDSERLDFFNQVLSHPCFLSEALCFAWEQAKVRGKSKVKVGSLS